MKHILITLLMFFSTKLYAENSQILKCRVENKEWKAVFLLDSTGTGFFKFKKNNMSGNYTCGLKLDYINDGQRAVVPEITFEFTRGGCDPEIGILQQEIFNNYTLIINLNNKEKPVGRVQWLKNRQPENCIVEKLNIFDVQLNAKKFNSGQMKRNTASDPKKAPKDGF